MRTRTLLAALVACGLTVGACSGEREVTISAFVDFPMPWEFTKGEAVGEKTLDLNTQYDFQALGADVTCAVLDVANSSVALTDFDGTEGETFSLRVSVLDGSSRVVLFDWSATLEQDARIVPLGDEATGLSSEGVARLGELALSDDRLVGLSFEYSAPSNPESVSIDVNLRIHMATEKGTCPENTLD